jgi:hypothetical protein
MGNSDGCFEVAVGFEDALDLLMDGCFEIRREWLPFHVLQCSGNRVAQPGTISADQDFSRDDLLLLRPGGAWAAKESDGDQKLA